MRTKKVLATVGTIAITAALAIGGTLAYMGQITETKKNEFSSTTKIIPKLEEVFNEDEARNYTPGNPIVKIPTVKNEETSTESMIAGMVLSYEWAGETVDLDAISKFVDIAWTEGDAWTEIGTDENGVTVYRYGVLEKGMSTDPALFTSVTVKANAMELLIKDAYDDIVKNDKDGKLYKIIPAIPDQGTEGVDYIVAEEKISDTLVSKTVYQTVPKADIDSTTKYYTQTGTKVFTEITYPDLPSFAINVTGLGVQVMDDVTAENAALLDLAAKAGYTA